MAFKLFVLESKDNECVGRNFIQRILWKLKLHNHHSNILTLKNKAYPHKLPHKPCLNNIEKENTNIRRLFDIIWNVRASGGMAYAVVSKTTSCKAVWVRLPPRPLKFKLSWPFKLKLISYIWMQPHFLKQVVGFYEKKII